MDVGGKLFRSGLGIASVGTEYDSICANLNCTLWRPAIALSPFHFLVWSAFCVDLSYMLVKGEPRADSEDVVLLSDASCATLAT